MIALTMLLTPIVVLSVGAGWMIHRSERKRKRLAQAELERRRQEAQLLEGMTHEQRVEYLLQTAVDQQRAETSFNDQRARMLGALIIWNSMTHPGDYQ